MADDLDKRRPPDEPEDDDLFDWLKDETDSSQPASGDRLGFTGELSWKQDVQGAFDEQSSAGGDDAFDWQQSGTSESTPSSPDRLGFTGQLDWKNVSDQLGSDAPTDDPLDWLTGISDDDLTGAAKNPTQSFENIVAEPDDMPAIAPDDDPLGWLKDYQSEPLDQAEPLQFDDDLPQADAEADPLTWLQGYKSGDSDEAPVEAAPASDDDWMSSMAASEIVDDDESFPVAEDVVPEGAAGDDNLVWLRQFAVADDEMVEEDPPSAPPTAEAASDDWFASFDDDDQPAAAEEDMPDWLQAAVPQQPSAERASWFSEPAPDEFAQADDMPDWLKEVQPQDAAAPEMPNPFEQKPGTSDEFFAALEADEQQPAARQDDPFGMEDIDALLSKYDTVEPVVNRRASDLEEADIDFESVFSEDELAKLNQLRGIETRSDDAGLSPDAPAWLTEIGASVGGVGEVSAAAILRRKAEDETPSEDLTDRLKALREAGLNLQPSEDEAPSQVIKSLLPGVAPVIAPVTLTAGPQGGLVSDLVLTDRQREKIDLLKGLVAAEAIAPDEAVAAKPARAYRPRWKPDRFLIALVLIAAVILPFFLRNLRLGQLPPVRFAAAGAEMTAYSRIETTAPGALVLIAAEYGPTGAAELDGMLDALTRHTLAKGARPVIVSGNPTGLLRAQSIVQSIAADAGFLSLIQKPALVANQDYYIIRYLVGENVGLRNFSQDLPGWVTIDINGAPTGLSVTSINDFALTAVIAERAEDVRGWAEQVAPALTSPLLMATSYSASVFAEPYARGNTRLAGLLVGYQDAYTYRVMLDSALTGVEPPGIPEESGPLPAQPIGPSPTPEPTLLPPTATVPPPTDETVGTPVTAEATSATIQPPAETTIPPTTTPTNVPPTATLTSLPPTATPTVITSPTGVPASPTPEQPAVTPSLTPTLEPTSPPVLIEGVVNTDVSINVREGPGRNFPPVAALTPGTRVQVIGRSGDGNWLQIRLADGREGWVSAALIRLEQPAVTPTGSAYDPQTMRVSLFSDSSYSDVGPVELQADITPPAPAPLPPDEDAAAVPAAIPYRDERWYSMTLGLIVIIAVIALGAIINIGRALFRRGK